MTSKAPMAPQKSSASRVSGCYPLTMRAITAARARFPGGNMDTGQAPRDNRSHMRLLSTHG
eukprot:scaffold7969_cov2595-Prasinococcus_capsulatus_cf.AAC.1